jgi:tRNA A58 N-methylase Trm61
MLNAEAIAAAPTAPDGHSHTCPWWLGWALASPVRRLVERPEQLLVPCVEPGSRVLEVGPGMGFFTLPLARRVGEQGHVVCRELQPRMLAGLKQRLERHGLKERVDARLCTPTALGIDDLAETIDTALLLYVLHEADDPAAMLRQIHAAVRKGGKMLIVEPSGHCSPARFEAQRQSALELGFVERQDGPVATRRRRVLWLERP